MYDPLPEHYLAPDASNVAVQEVSFATMAPRFIPTGLGASRQSFRLPNGRTIETLLVNRGSNELLLGFHGAVDRRAYKIPRFEWRKTLESAGLTCLYIADPGLQTTQNISLAWYTGWQDLEVGPIVREIAAVFSEALGCERRVYFGSSGGGFAALQSSASDPKSLAVPFNPQTDIEEYIPSVQRTFVRSLMPDLADTTAPAPFPKGWSTPIRDRISAVARYSQPLENYVYFVQNINDESHMNLHVPPFRAAIESFNPPDRFQIEFYDGPIGHVVPRGSILVSNLRNALNWHSRALENDKSQ